MKKTEFYSSRLREGYTRIEHESGLTVYVFPKKLTGIYALFATDFGSVHTAYRKEPNGEVITLPEGIAHFLEHKLFENEDGSDSFARFSALGADANAYTSYNRTAYLFSCTDHFEDSLAELLRFVTTPHFTDESVQREIGIISEEIRMTEDNPWDRGYQMMLEAMYCKHPVRLPICGTQESIRRIDPQLLYECHRLFYDPSHMTLVVCGDVKTEEVMKTVDAAILTRTHISAQRVGTEEPETVRKAYVDAQMQVSKPIFFMGFKDPFVPSDPNARIRRDAAMTLLDEILFSRSGEIYSELFESGVLSPTFTCGYSIGEDFAFNCVSGESDTPDAVVERVMEYVERVRQEGIADEDLERCRRVLYSDEVRAYDSTEEIANRLLSFVLDGADMLEYPNLFEQITKEELVSLLDTLFRREYLSVSVIYPLEQR
ncbi:MAG: insulinase family protein [Clostridia bacterium]|nr:insulinase family protein [Clostridia bacterium]